MGSGITQTAYQIDISSQKEDDLKGTALQTDFGYIYTEIKELKKQLNTNNL